MKQWYLFRLFFREMGSQKKRIWLTVSGIAWGTLSIILLLSFGEGLKRQLLTANKGLGVNIVILYGGQTSKTYQGLPRGRRIGFTDEDVELLKGKIPEITGISGEYDLWGQSFTYGETTLTERATGVLPPFEYMRTHYPQAGGRFINKTDIEQRRRVVFLGNELKDRLMGEIDPIGETIHISGTPFTVIGVMQEKMQMSMYGGPDASKASIPSTTLKALEGRTYLSRIVYQVNRTELAPLVEKRVYEILGRKYRFDPEDSKALGIWDTIEQSSMMGNMLTGIQLFLGLIGALTLLIASVGVANIMYVSVKERTREIGVKRALGAKRFHVKQQFILEAALIAVIGGLIGGVFAFIIVTILQNIPFGDGPLQLLGKPTFSVPIFLSTAVILGVVGLAAGFFPAQRAAKVDPIESLRYE
ncbi:MAG: ABC transporter permease [Candidatus Marinimicrobia bacterium]|nr:ABC transporter permease [Candidatus Neomarinimicrobiota bacterium]MCF7828626.1 ABC transporter permease [Candidatus Neomarinimicrobiota bacterium]MCF7880367.1 ABC transporter permease [Candidatus Neomarinimicrobiota bacterium]